LGEFLGEFLALLEELYRIAAEDSGFLIHQSMSGVFRERTVLLNCCAVRAGVPLPLGNRVVIPWRILVGELTQLFDAVNAAERGALDRLLAGMYQELHQPNPRRRPR
jgi:hypothetical protein